MSTAANVWNKMEYFGMSHCRAESKIGYQSSISRYLSFVEKAIREGDMERERLYLIKYISA